MGSVNRKKNVAPSYPNPQFFCNTTRFRDQGARFGGNMFFSDALPILQVNSG